jgi:3-oxoadipate enol-lactonase
VGVGRWGWEPVAARLARRFQVVSIDNRGIGASDTAPGHYSTRVMADDVLAVLDHAGVQQASLVGTSLGGMIAQELALAHPERVDRLVLVATIPGGPRSRPMPLPTTYLFAWAPFMTSQAKLQQFVHTTLGPETLRRRPKVARRLAARKLAHPPSPQAWRAQTEAGMLFNPLGRQRRITQPTLVVQGTADQVVDPGNAEVLAGLVPDAKVQRFDGAGHLLYWEQPKRFVRVVTDFLTDPPSAARVPAAAARRAS